MVGSTSLFVDLLLFGVDKDRIVSRSGGPGPMGDSQGLPGSYS